MWRKSEATGAGQVVTVEPGMALSIPRRTHFQFRADAGSPGPLAVEGATVPAWPGIGDMSGRDEAYLVAGPWAATVESGADLS
jgi:mannose-6-phosphate isomerase-like protein (cupin superfamily)